MGNSSPQVQFMPEGWQITCCRLRLKCGGCFACSEVNPKLLDIEHYELDLTSCDKVFAAQRKTRDEEGNMAEKQMVVCVTTIFDTSLMQLTLPF
jgi:hypothetical protein